MPIPAALTLIAGALTVWALNSRDRARVERDTARATLLASNALGELDNDPSQALISAMRAYTTRQTDLSEGVLRLATAQTTPQLILRGHTGPVGGVAFARDGRHVAADDDRTVRVWSWRAPRTPRPSLTASLWPPAKMGRCGYGTGARPLPRRPSWAATPSGSPVWRSRATSATSRAPATMGWCGCGTGARRAPPRPILRSHTRFISAVAFAPDGRHVASAGTVRVWDGRGTVRVWDWRAPRAPPTILRSHTRFISACEPAKPTARRRRHEHLAQSGAGPARRRPQA